MFFFQDFGQNWFRLVCSTLQSAGEQDSKRIDGKNVRVFLCSRMGFLVGSLEFFGGEVGVDLGGGEVCVA